MSAHVDRITPAEALAQEASDLTGVPWVACTCSSGCEAARHARLGLRMSVRDRVRVWHDVTGLDIEGDTMGEVWAMVVSLLTQRVGVA